MNRGLTIFLKVALIVLGLTTLLLAVFILPWVAREAALQNPEYAYLRYPVLIGILSTMIPFIYGLYEGLKLVDDLEGEKMFSQRSVKALQRINYCGVTIGCMYVAGSIGLMIFDALHPSIAIMGVVIVFFSLVTAVAASLLQRFVKRAIVIKAENDLTV